MNWQHFRAVLWLRWRLRVNQLKRVGIANVLVLVMLAIFVVPLPFVLFTIMFFVGLYALPEAMPPIVMFVWDGLIFFFLFAWSMGLITDLQRSDALSLDKFLHLPVSLPNVFIINYLSSLISLNVMLFVPAMLGLAIGQVVAHGLDMLLLVPLIASFVLMVTAVTYQFQGWLAALMVNKRRRRTIIVVVTMTFVLLFHLPNLLNIMRPWDKDRSGNAADSEQRDRQLFKEAARIAWIINIALPPGWLAVGATAAVEDNIIPLGLGFLGMSTIGAASLWRSYQTTVRLYTGQFTSKKKRLVPSDGPAKASVPAVGLLEKKIPWVSEHASTIAVGGLQSLLRAPEAKMMLLTPVILSVVAGSLLLTRPMDFEIPLSVRPVLVFSGMMVVLLGMIQLLANQFGFDRSGFRVFVLCSARRDSILLGKNIAMAPLALAMAGAVIVVMQFIFPLRWDHLLAVIVQPISMYALMCSFANWLSIYAPMPIASGTLKPSNPKLAPILLQMLFLFLLPPIMALTLIPLGFEAAFLYLGWVEGAPLCLLLSVLECGLILFAYRFLLIWQGNVLHAREQRVLEIVTTKAE